MTTKRNYDSLPFKSSRMLTDKCTRGTLHKSFRVPSLARFKDTQFSYQDEDILVPRGHALELDHSMASCACRTRHAEPCELPQYRLCYEAQSVHHQHVPTRGGSMVWNSGVRLACSKHHCARVQPFVSRSTLHRGRRNLSAHHR